MMEAPSAPTDLKAFFASVRPAVDSALDNLLPAESVSPPIIHQAMRYSTLGGGKRFRPCLCIAGYLGGSDDWTAILPVAAAIEMIHSYSLIHDDLPAMDDDDERRGRPACHKKFNEAIAILAGDALLSLAFETLGRVDAFPPERMLHVVSVLAGVVGTREGMIAGQVLDIGAEGTKVTPTELELIHRSKTGALIGGSVWIGGYLAEFNEEKLARVSRYGECVGLAFQILDDVDDEMEGAGRDLGKATYPGIHGIEKSRAIARELLRSARQAVAPLGERSRILIELCDFLENR
jgi:geranylgeranyl diphosphate synthase type II